MGRTVTPYSMQLQYVRKRLTAFRRSLRAKDQEAFDEVMLYAKLHVQGGVAAAFPDPADGVLLSGLIELQKKFKEQQKELSEIKQKLEELQQKSANKNNQA